MEKERYAMRKMLPKLTLLIVFVICSLPMAAPAKDEAKHQPVQEGNSLSERGVLWQDPVDIESRNLFYGSGGKEHEPPGGVFTFVEEDPAGTSPKIEVRDRDGVKWKVKFGEEARPETAASRFVWAAGYFTNEDYFVENLKVQGLPPHLKRGQNFVEPDGSLRNVRLKRHLKGEEKIGTWRWRRDPFTDTPELNGLRVVMAVINNWDLKDENNAVYKMDKSPDPIYMVSDLGASFGTTGYILSRQTSRGNLNSYNRSHFISRVTSDYVDFTAPSRPTLLEVSNPPLFLRRVNIEWIGKHIPRADAKRMGQLLGRLSPDQIRDAFRSAGYAPEEVDGFASVMKGRIDELNTL
jgi:hypothetical protein